MKYPKIKAAVKDTEVVALVANMPLAITEAGFFLAADQMDGIEASLTAAESATADVTRLTGELATVSGQLATANTELSAVNGQLTTANARIAELEAMGPGTQVHTFKAKDEGANADNNKKYLTSFDAMIVN